jgi:hypothetical protein
MSLFTQWQQQIEDTANPTEYQAFVQHYYDLETDAYDKILTANDPRINGQAKAVAQALGFGQDMVVFLGFLDGVSPCLLETVDLDSITEESELDVTIDFEKLYWKMHEAKADWLYNLPSWQNVLSEDRRKEITRDYRQSKIVRTEKVGRNDPCPCGSGKKFKACCGKNQGVQA